MLLKLSLIAASGAAGTLMRYWVSGLSQRLFGGYFPYGTLSVNVLGSLLFGVVWALADERMALSPLARAAVLVGFMGAFTTFSTFAFETVGYVQDGRFISAFFNLALNCVLGFGAVLGGLWLGRAV